MISCWVTGLALRFEKILEVTDLLLPSAERIMGLPLLFVGIQGTRAMSPDLSSGAVETCHIKDLC